MRCLWAELVTRVGGYMARRTRLGGCAAKPIIDHHEGRLVQEDNAEVIGATVNEWLIDLGLGPAQNTRCIIGTSSDAPKQKENHRCSGISARLSRHKKFLPSFYPVKRVEKGRTVKLCVSQCRFFCRF